MEKTELNYGETLLFEKYFYGSSEIPLEEQYLYFQIIRQTKDLVASKHYLENTPSKFELVFMAINKDKEGITFNGAVSNGIENRTVDGIIKKHNSSYVVITHVYRLHQSVKDDEKEYYVYDTFKLKKDKIIQETIYDESLEYRNHHQSDDSYKTVIPSFDMEAFYEFRETVAKTYKV